MVEIKQTSIEGFMEPLGGEGDVKVSLFLVSKKSPRLKKLNLENLSPEERAAKLNSVGQENRFVLVIQKGDVVFAHAHSKHAAGLQKSDDLSLDGRKVLVKVLSDEDAEQVAAIGAAFDEHVLDQLEEKIEKKLKEEDDEVSQHTHKQPMSRQQYLAKKTLISDEVHSHFLVKQMTERNLGQLITECMKRYQEARAELKKQQEADDKYFNIKRSEIKKEIARAEIKAEEVKHQEQRRHITAEDIKRTKRTRGS
jgi:hypothetical protein